MSNPIGLLKNRIFQRAATFLPVCLLCLVAASGCAPSIDELDIADTNGDFPPMPGVEIDISASITEKNTEMETPVVSIKTPFQSDSNYADAGLLTDRVEIERKRYRYTGRIDALDYGAYDLRLSVPYHAWFRLFYQTEVVRFNVPAPEGCFSFAAGQPLEFTASAVFKSHGEEFGSAAIVWRPINWPMDLQHDGSATIQILANQFPRSQDEEYYWFVDFISPSLVSDSMWSESHGVTLRLASKAAGLFAQPIINIVDPESGDTRALTPKDNATGKFLVYPISDASEDPVNWKSIDWSSDLLVGEWLGLQIRIYGDVNSTAMNTDTTIYLDGVCPIPPGVYTPGVEPVQAIVNPWQ